MNLKGYNGWLGEISKRYRQSQIKAAVAVNTEMLKFYFESAAYKGMNAVAMHDSVPFMYLLHEEMFSGESHIMHVSCTEDTCRGMTFICDGAYTYTDKTGPKNVFVLKDVDSEAFRREIMKTLLR